MRPNIRELYRLLPLVLLSAAMAACAAPTSDAAVLRALRTQLAQQYHECVPVGWTATTVAGTYYSGSSAEYRDTSWIAPLWLGTVSRRDLQRREMRTASAILDALARAGLVDERHALGRSFYHLDVRALPYYYEDNGYGNNPDHWPYLCYSAIVPERIVWTQAPHLESRRDGSGDVQTFRVAFQWVAGPRAPWAKDPVLRAHSVVLSPTKNPVVVKFEQLNGTWQIVNLYTPFPDFPRVVDASAWK